MTVLKSNSIIPTENLYTFVVLMKKLIFNTLSLNGNYSWIIKARLILRIDLYDTQLVSKRMFNIKTIKIIARIFDFEDNWPKYANEQGTSLIIKYPTKNLWKSIE